MDEKLFAQVKYSADDYIRVGVFMRKHLFLYKYGFEITFISVFFAVAVVIFVLADDKSAINYLGLISFGVFLAFFAGTLIYLGDKFISPLLSRRYVARLLKSSPLLNQENDICFSNEGI